jgi:hypothetical protein
MLKGNDMQTFGSDDKVAPPPYLADIGVMSLVPDVWEASWQPRHHVLTRLSRYFNVVWYHPLQKQRNSLSRFTSWNQDID